ncbi:thiamine phosphate synthase [Metabacillus herbersteinensis]|uniref:Thiamine phosphate synthase n=1 Tax=Metabacillus herbersteinensis TaxID=283816 RepID=A0ABV6GE44_9BACI
MSTINIHIVTDGKKDVKQLIHILTAIHTEVETIQIREKTKTAAELIGLVNGLVKEGVPKNKLIINDRVDVALLCEIPTVHLPGHSFAVDQLKAHFPHLRVGCSVHTLVEAKKAEDQGADYLIFGHVFQTTSKANLPARGIGQLDKICRSTDIPVIAIGGVSPSTISHLKKVKPHGCAVMSYVLDHQNPLEAVREIKRNIQEGYDETSL